MAKIRASLLAILFLSLIGSVRLCAQESAEATHFEPIPKDHYKTWSLFLICNPRWMADDKTKDLGQLYKAFRAFGDTIGRDNLAVWFWKHKYFPGRKLDDVDLARSTDFCSR